MARLMIDPRAIALAITLLGSTAFAETQAEIAERENEEGKTLMFAGKYAEASAKFQDASARVGEPKYYFNLCTSRFQEGKFGEALTACNAADKNGDDKIRSKTARLREKIQQEAQKQGIDLQPTGGGGGPGETPPVGDPNQPSYDPNNPNAMPPGQPPPGYAVGRPPSVGLFQTATPENKYTWSLGVELMFGGGQIGEQDRFGTNAAGVRFKGDYLLNPAQRLGAQGYVQLSAFNEGDVMTTTGAQSLDIVDVGLAGFKHLCGARSRGCLTPLLGVQLAFMSPADDNDGRGTQVFNYASLGARAEIGYHYAFGRRYEHVFGAMLGTNLYTRPFSEPGDAASRGLARGGAAGYFSLGYTYRFQTPFGTTPFVTLE
jgi:hypothetical protein